MLKALVKSAKRLLSSKISKAVIYEPIVELFELNSCVFHDPLLFFVCGIGVGDVLFLETEVRGQKVSVAKKEVHTGRPRMAFGLLEAFLFGLSRFATAEEDVEGVSAVRYYRRRKHKFIDARRCSHR